MVLILLYHETPSLYFIALQNTRVPHQPPHPAVQIDYKPVYFYLCIAGHSCRCKYSGFGGEDWYPLFHYELLIMILIECRQVPEKL